MHDFKKLKVWQKARLLVKGIYSISKEFPSEERYGLTAQIRRSAISIPSNIAEGCGRSTPPQVLHFLDIAQGSCFELETQLILSVDLNYINEQKLNVHFEQIDEIQKMIVGYKKYLIQQQKSTLS